MRQKPDREAAFKVLKSAKVPSVLIELAFVTNRQDAKLLKSEKWRNRVSGSIVSAVDNYFSHTVTRLPL
jgi:N-acetylmuramoyl-L-alanine amidase